MLLKVVRTFGDEHDDELVRCAVIWESDSQYTVKCIEPAHFDPEARYHQQRNFTGPHWRVDKVDAELTDEWFDTADIKDRTVRVRAEFMVGENHVQFNAILVRLRNLLDRLLELGEEHPGNGSDPMSHVREQANSETLHFDYVIPRWFSRALGGGGEFRLNGAGLKFWIRICDTNPESEDGIFQCRITIGGDQAKDYPEFVEAARRVIDELGFNQDC